MAFFGALCVFYLPASLLKSNGNLPVLITVGAITKYRRRLQNVVYRLNEWLNEGTTGTLAQVSMHPLPIRILCSCRPIGAPAWQPIIKRYATLSQNADMTFEGRSDIGGNVRQVCAFPQKRAIAT